MVRRSRNFINALSFTDAVAQAFHVPPCEVAWEEWTAMNDAGRLDEGEAVIRRGLARWRMDSACGCPPFGLSLSGQEYRRDEGGRRIQARLFFVSTNRVQHGRMLFLDCARTRHESVLIIVNLLDRLYGESQLQRLVDMPDFPRPGPGNGQ